MITDFAKWFSSLVGGDIAYLLVAIPVYLTALAGWVIVFRATFLGGRMAKWTTWEKYQANTKTASEHHKYKHLRDL
jgi:hypothetical protein